MNLADAIRRAALVTARDEEVTAVPTGPTESAVAGAVDFESIDDNTLEGLNLQTQPGPGLIRLELFLPPDQLHRLIRSVAATQHTVLTLREAASHLRITTARLEELAGERQIPAFQVDGKWRFSRARLEEWVTENTLKENSLREQVS
jgi:excisionase family DNA binding protein